MRDPRLSTRSPSIRGFAGGVPRGLALLTALGAALLAAACSSKSGALDARLDARSDAPADARVADGSADFMVDAPADSGRDLVGRDVGEGSEGGAAELAIDIDSGGDRDGDGIDDAQEQVWAEAYFPYYAVVPGDSCALHGVVFRLAPHPQDPQLIMIWYVVLYQRDCGALGHLGDVETFGVVADPRTPAPAGILGLRAISHQGTLCQRITSCGTLPSCSSCATAPRNGKAYPVIFASRDKHGQYAEKSACDLNFICDFGGCTISPAPDVPVLVNAGEPGKPLLRNLTTEGFVTPQKGWTETQLYDFDPWGTADFGSVGSVRDDLADNAYVIDPKQGC